MTLHFIGLIHMFCVAKLQNTVRIMMPVSNFHSHGRCAGPFNCNNSNRIKLGIIHFSGFNG